MKRITRSLSEASRNVSDNAKTLWEKLQGRRSSINLKSKLANFQSHVFCQGSGAFMSPSKEDRIVNIEDLETFVREHYDEYDLTQFGDRSKPSPPSDHPFIIPPLAKEDELDLKPFNTHIAFDPTFSQRANAQQSAASTLADAESIRPPSTAASVSSRFSFLRGAGSKHSIFMTRNKSSASSIRTMGDLDLSHSPSDSTYFQPPELDKFKLYCVFDGHCGKTASSFLQYRFPFELCGNESFKKGDYQRALIETYHSVHRELLLCDKYEPEPPSNDFASGATASVVLFTPTYTYFAMLGDSPILTWKRHEDRPDILFKEHDAENPQIHDYLIRSNIFFVLVKDNPEANIYYLVTRPEIKEQCLRTVAQRANDSNIVYVHPTANQPIPEQSEDANTHSTHHETSGTIELESEVESRRLSLSAPQAAVSVPDASSSNETPLSSSPQSLPTILEQEVPPQAPASAPAPAPAPAPASLPIPADATAPAQAPASSSVQTHAPVPHPVPAPSTSATTKPSPLSASFSPDANGEVVESDESKSELLMEDEPQPQNQRVDPPLEFDDIRLGMSALNVFGTLGDSMYDAEVYNAFIDELIAFREELNRRYLLRMAYLQERELRRSKQRRISESQNPSFNTEDDRDITFRRNSSENAAQPTIDRIRRQSGYSLKSQGSPTQESSDAVAMDPNASNFSYSNSSCVSNGNKEEAKYWFESIENLEELHHVNVEDFTYDELRGFIRGRPNWKFLCKHVSLLQSKESVSQILLASIRSLGASNKMNGVAGLLRTPETTRIPTAHLKMVVLASDGVIRYYSKCKDDFQSIIIRNQESAAKVVDELKEYMKWLRDDRSVIACRLPDPVLVRRRRTESPVPSPAPAPGSLGENANHASIVTN
ncbi:uncharacterized protein BJ171DRAFT_257015 [Polychytrium aggregatum]|uniref:uncharacterized protein n=1 Tax=Polychytrium aggregatum TaxID=110093 RepID=UPI0022FDDC31|nr:uncharacterized protein BJ171DRAFT_257015 [Polychytrium aggregatum]KAI9207898.1 hypothetical protein BJ171DRAFT_257015 [Polychytrium aggregatum]